MRLNNNNPMNTLFLVLLLIAMVTAMFVSMKASNNKYEYEKTTVITVMPNDTLWSIAENVRTPNQDVRAVIEEIRALNDMPSATIHGGEKLIVPLY